MQHCSQLHSGTSAALLERHLAPSFELQQLRSHIVILDEEDAQSPSESSSSSDDEAQADGPPEVSVSRRQDGIWAVMPSTDCRPQPAELSAAEVQVPSKPASGDYGPATGNRQCRSAPQASRTAVGSAAAQRDMPHLAGAALQPPSRTAAVSAAAQRDRPHLAGAALQPPAPPSLPQLRSSRPGSASNCGSCGTFGSRNSFGSGNRLAQNRSSAALDALRAAGMTSAMHDEHHSGSGSATLGMKQKLRLPAPPAPAHVAEEDSAEDSLAPELVPLQMHRNGMQACTQRQRHDLSSIALSCSADACSLSPQQLQSSAANERRSAEAARHSICSLVDGRWHGQELELVECSPGSRDDVSPTAPLASINRRPPSAGAHIIPPVSPRTTADAGIEMPEQTYTRMLEQTVERLRREQEEGERKAHMQEAALKGKSQEVESLRQIVRELTSARAKAATTKQLLQERHSQLLDDYARQLRVADIARTVQREAATASLRGIQAEENCAVVRRVALQLRDRNRSLAAENTLLRGRVADMERVALMHFPGGGHMPAFSQLRCVETSY